MKKPSKSRSARKRARQDRRHGAIENSRPSRVGRPAVDIRARDAAARPPTSTGQFRALEDYDASELSRAKTEWFFGEWEHVAALDLERLSQHPDRDQLAMLVTSARQQLGEHDLALKSARLAISWGCNQKLIAQILVAGVHNTLGRASALARKTEQATQHFQSAVTVGSSGGSSTKLMGHARSVREMTKLGLLPDAAELMQSSLVTASGFTERPGQNQARLRMLEAEMELMRGGLSLAAKRKQLYTGAADEDGTDRATDDDKASTSQLGQDLWVLEMTGHKRNGYFVEFGATDGILLSNTYMLENRYGWRGICAEPHPDFFAKLKTNRQCEVSDACIAGTGGRDVEFILADEYGGMTDFATLDSHADKRRAFRSLGRTTLLRTTSLHELLTKHHAPQNIDYLSVDTEGSEYDILQSFPFEKWKIKCITVEHNFSETREAIRELLESKGYVRQEAQWDDWYHLR